MKLYHWCDVQALADYSNGDVFILAESLEQARATAIQDLRPSVAAEIQITEPNIYYEPVAIDVKGSA